MFVKLVEKVRREDVKMYSRPQVVTEVLPCDTNCKLAITYPYIKIVVSIADLS